MFQSPIYGSRTQLPVVPVAMLGQFQSPIYGSRTQRNTAFQFGYTRVSIPYLRVTHSKPFWNLTTASRVSIPYLRVTHELAMGMHTAEELVSIPYLRVTHTTAGKVFGAYWNCFNPLSTGHALQLHERWKCEWNVSIPYLRVTHLFFIDVCPNIYSVSIPYLRVTHDTCPNWVWFTGTGFNPLSTGHALITRGWGRRSKRVSIPYLRVTHLDSLVTYRLAMLVSIPYLRVTHSSHESYLPKV